MALYRRIVFSSDENFVPWFECNSSCEASPPPSVDTVSISFANRNRYLANVVTIAISVIASVFFVSLVCFLCSRRRQRPRRPLLPHAAAAAAAAASFSASDDGEELHAIWYIQTIGLDEATIRSVAVAEYKAGDGLLGATDCSVCLGEFQDGELIRLLPKCGHAFHLPCIDTWLRSHVNCPLCRADIIDLAADHAGATSSPPGSATPVPISVEVSSSLAPTDNPNVGIQSPEGDHGGQDREEEDRGLETGIGTGILTDELPESSELRVQGDLVEGGFHPIRRSASMDSPFLGTLAEESSGEEAKDPNFGAEEGIKNEGKQGNSSKDRIRSLSSRSFSLSSSRSFFSRQGRVPRNSILPL